MSRFNKNTTCASLRNPESPEIQAANASAIIQHVEFNRTANCGQIASKLEVAPETVRPRVSYCPPVKLALGETRETSSDHCSCRPFLLIESGRISTGNMEGWSGQSQHHTATTHVGCRDTLRATNRLRAKAMTSGPKQFFWRILRASE